jgi:hypothetical protein
MIAHAGEAQLACNLERSQAEVRASTLSAPQAYGSLGQDPITSSKSAIAGISQSFSGRVQASKIREAAEARCDAIRSTLAIEENARFAVASIQHDSATAELRMIEKAILLAKSNISQLDAQLSAQTITISTHTEARSELIALEQRQSALLRTLSAVVIRTPGNIGSLLEVARQNEATAARLIAEAQSESGWDVVAQAGVRQPLTGGSSTTFGTISFKYSFGYNASKDAARAVGSQTAELLAAQQGGFTQTVLRQRKELQSLVEAETLSIATTARQIEHLNRVRNSMVGIETALAQNTSRALDLQLLILAADESASQVRLAGYKALLEKIS